MEEQLLRNKRLRVTPFRKKVLSVLLKSDTTLSLNEIESALGEHDRITLYRTLKTFTEQGVIHEIVMPGEIKKLALCPPVCEGGEGHHNHNHLHFQCKKCQEVYCVEIPNTPEIQLAGFQIDSIEIQARGTCKDCK